MEFPNYPHPKADFRVARGWAGVVMVTKIAIEKEEGY